MSNRRQPRKRKGRDESGSEGESMDGSYDSDIDGTCCIGFLAREGARDQSIPFTTSKE